jgi:electron-transferring-flavoprotein dehydrogenase
MEAFDVVIIGGGPAGMAAGHAAARGGADTLIIEKGVPRDDRPDQLGPDSTDAAGILDYWVDMMQLDPAGFPDGVIVDVLDRAEFIGPTESLTLRSTGLPASYEHFGFCMHRARFDDYLRERATEAGAVYEVGTAVADVDLADVGYRMHTIALRDGRSVEAPHLILADGPQRQVTGRVLAELLPAETVEQMATPRTNHIAYQEHRRLPPEVAAELDGSIRFWWGHMPGHTAYPWIFPNDQNTARIGLTMPIGLELADVDAPQQYPLLRPDDTAIPSGAEYIRRLLEMEYGDSYDIDQDFPIVADRGKRAGTETYAISSTRPIDSPTHREVAIVGGAMGATSAFHEGGDHTAIATGRIAGELAAEGTLTGYNPAWKAAIGDEVIRNVAMADVVAPYGPADWDRSFRTARRILRVADGYGLFRLRNLLLGLGAIRLLYAYRSAKRTLRDGRYVQITADQYANG